MANEVYVVIYTLGAGEEALVGVADSWDSAETMIRNDMIGQGTSYNEYEVTTAYLNHAV